ncbi:hypothetical protein [Spirosoma agri]|uniref:Lipocalin-like domain-containing protein n=1 Tax=Spirosoma agri TaxID=1987381 RepID=A0A6M0IID4_9BACT|nr:hypothetical protein [Spirosoma agri]NEU67455.1 hypothetical protein [Spirosoma agri]
MPPALNRNLVGTWHYKATSGLIDGAPTTGSLRFKPDGTVDDPDQVLGSNQQQSSGSIIAKLYTVSNESVAIRLATKDQIVAIIFLNVDANTCDKITLRPAYDQSGNYIELTDKAN